MTIHCSLEDLSTLLDEELAARDRRRVEEHVERCGECRKRLLDLRRVRGHLRRLEAVEPPPTLDWRVRAGVRLEPRRGGLGRRLGDHISTWTRQPIYAPLFALVVALATISYLLSVGVARERQAPTRIIAPPAAEPVAEAVPDAAEEEQPAAGARRELAQAAARVAEAPAARPVAKAAPPPVAEEPPAVSATLEQAPPAATSAAPSAAEPAREAVTGAAADELVAASAGMERPARSVEAEARETSPPTLSLAGRTLVWRDGAWWEDGLESSPLPRAAGAVRREDLPAALAWLSEAPAGIYVVWLDDVATRVDLPPAR